MEYGHDGGVAVAALDSACEGMAARLEHVLSLLSCIGHSRDWLFTVIHWTFLSMVCPFMIQVAVVITVHQASLLSTSRMRRL
jgi:hypothetical protein